MRMSLQIRVVYAGYVGFGVFSPAGVATQLEIISPIEASTVTAEIASGFCTPLVLLMEACEY
jgi:hypothetical protein